MSELPFDFSKLALFLALISLSIIGVVMAGSVLFPELAERFKRQIPTVIVGLVIVAVAGTIVSMLTK